MTDLILVVAVLFSILGVSYGILRLVYGLKAMRRPRDR